MDNIYYHGLLDNAMDRNVLNIPERGINAMTYISDTAFIPLSEPQDHTDDIRKAQAYFEAKENAADVMLSTEPRVLGSARLAQLLGVTTRLQREISG